MIPRGEESPSRCSKATVVLYHSARTPRTSPLLLASVHPQFLKVLIFCKACKANIAGYSPLTESFKIFCMTTVPDKKVLRRVRGREQLGECFCYISWRSGLFFKCFPIWYLVSSYMQKFISFPSPLLVFFIRNKSGVGVGGGGCCLTLH